MKNNNTFLIIGVTGLAISFVINVVMYFLIGNSNSVMVSLWTPIYINFVFFVLLGLHQIRKAKIIARHGGQDDAIG
ncbi:hypothetical protein LJ739_07785 [Aestuariibacter halophilus]|uniref:Uncharacterized protein n=1 Tax=Fluctibacter halophilus TaxID=226011 RepID=A0ABS8G7M8_9ALTE|nr:hypothetical protein [Aestuariibacter halophilus]MCC2616136.1 hypothetical protein [Aestuariibacter halophilus]